jgi:hypothetical protein
MIIVDGRNRAPDKPRLAAPPFGDCFLHNLLYSTKRAKSLLFGAKLLIRNIPGLPSFTGIKEP